MELLQATKMISLPQPDPIPHCQMANCGNRDGSGKNSEADFRVRVHGHEEDICICHDCLLNIDTEFTIVSLVQSSFWNDWFKFSNEYYQSLIMKAQPTPMARGMLTYLHEHATKVNSQSA